MDAVASIINIIQLTSTLIEYLRAAKQATSDRRRLLVEANSLLALLISLRDFTELEDQHEYPDWRRAIHQLEVPGGPFAQYQAELESLLARVSPSGRLEKAARTVLWKISKDDVSEVLARLERLKSLIGIALEMDHTRLSEAIRKELADISTTTNLIRANTLKLVNSMDEADFRSLLDQICTDDYSSVFQSNITEHTAGIGHHFMSSPEFEDWAHSAEVTKPLLCVGDPGVGKTVLSTKAIQALRKRTAPREAVVFVYCDCTRRRSRLSRRDSSPEARSKGVQTPSHFVASLLRQLIALRGSPTASLQETLSQHDQQKTRTSLAELESLFLEAAQELDRIYVVVDALDECDSLEVETFADRLISICAASNMRLLLTSRRHPQIEQVFEDAVRVELRAYDSDTIRYLQSRARREFPSRVLRDSTTVERVLQALLLSANGIPLIARLHMNALRGVRTPGTMLSTINRLKGESGVYDETYHAAMERITQQPGELPAMAVKVIRWIVCAKRYLYTRELQCILAMQDDSESLDEDFVPDMDDVFLACEGLVCVVNDDRTEWARLELVHTTARQYFDTRLVEWAPDVNLDLASTCLNVMAIDDFAPLPQSLVVYAWRYWGQHARDVEDMNEQEQFSLLLSRMRSFFSKEKDGRPLVQAVNHWVKHTRFANEQHEDLTAISLLTRFGLSRSFKALWEAKDDFGGTDQVPRDWDGSELSFEDASMGVEMVRVMFKAIDVDVNASAEDRDRAWMARRNMS